MKTIIPGENYLYVETVIKSNTTASGIVTAIEEEVESTTGRVLSVGRGVDDYAEGETIVFKEYAATPVTLDRVKYYLIHRDDILGKLVDKD